MTLNNPILLFTKGPAKIDEVEFRLGTSHVVQLQNPKQRILPHDMIHYAVEQCFAFEGFIQLVFQGYDPAKTMQTLAGYAPKLPGEYSQRSWIAESLVECFQAMLWSQGSSFADFLYAYESTCRARDLEPEPIAEENFDRCLEMISELQGRWDATAVGASLELPFQPLRK